MLQKVILCLLLTIGAFFLFTNLSDQYLWEDEAETAVFGKNILTYGYPTAFDGKNLVRIRTNTYRSNMIWTFHPWLQFYITAFSFSLFGKTTFAARFLFAVLGFLSLIATYILCLKLFRNRSLAALSLSFLVFSIPFILHMRQCRYYAPAVLFTLLLVISYIHFIQDKKYSFLSFLICGNFLFHSNYGIFLPVISGISLHYLIFHFKSHHFKKFLLLLTTTFILTFPWFLYLRGFQHGAKNLDYMNIVRSVEFYFRMIYKFITPIVFFGIAAAAQFLLRKKYNIFKFYLNYPKEKVFLLLFIVLTTCFFSLLGEQRFFRYIIHLVPLLLIIQALMMVEWFKKSPYVVSSIIVLLLFTNILHYSLPTLMIKWLPQTTIPFFAKWHAPGKLEHNLKHGYFSPAAEFIYELTHKYKDVEKGMVEFLLSNAKPLDTIAVPYADLPLMFYTPFKIYNIAHDGEVFADWIVFQEGWFKDFYSPLEKSHYVKKIKENYEPWTIDYPDLKWGNMPDPFYHKFKTVVDAPRLVIYKKKK